MQFSINFDCFLKSENVVHAYCFGTDNRLIQANPLQIEVIKVTCGLKAEDEILNKPLAEVFKNNQGNFLQIICEENHAVMASESIKQFYNVWINQYIGEIKLLTIKMPFYDKDGKLSGVVGISQYLSKLALPANIKEKLSKREAECLTALLENKSVQQIADTLNLSKRTIEYFLAQAKNKLGCASNAELIAKLIHFKEDFLQSYPFHSASF